MKLEIFLRELDSQITCGGSLAELFSIADQVLLTLGDGV